MRHRIRRGLALSAAAALFLAGCGDGEAPEDGADAPTEEGLDDQALDDPFADEAELDDPNEDVEDGVYRGNGVVLPVPEGWSLDPTAAAQGIVAAFSEDGTQQMSGQAIDAESAAAPGEDVDLDVLLDGIRQQVGQDPDVDEEVELTGAERAHRLTYLNLPAQQEGMPTSSVTLVLAEDGSGLLAEFAFGAAVDDYDDDLVALMLANAGFDPDSAPPPPPEQPAP